ncbi:hypothetical protein SAMN06265339_0935 [Desulfurobacterium pacificum]|jgi:YbbR domain-containing protein|uniref:Uncharacterized protein n=1 Tax=Desulfurobacterium pacificum TaxID=240166 RepID=A0ABY1NKA5_9BACT|nr:hypothetical protein SAMN06265339_0935 [Desulfurobacterium pacificum]
MFELLGIIFSVIIALFFAYFLFVVIRSLEEAK